MEFKLTYATMFNPPEELHTKYDAALAQTKTQLGREHAMLINNQDVLAEEKFEDHSPINTDWVLAMTTVLPVTRAAPAGPPVRAKGKLKGLITSQTPYGRMIETL